MRPRVSIVVPVRNGARTLPRTLPALAALEPAPDEIVLVDNASSDDTLERLEVLRGRIEAILKAADADQLRRAHTGLLAPEAFLAQFAIVPLDDVAIAQFERLRPHKRLKKIGRGDLLNACIALAHGATLVTRNTKDYANIPGLKLENWAD